MEKKLLRKQEEIDEFLENLIEQNCEKQNMIALDIETTWFDSKTRWSPLQLELDGIGLYNGKESAFIVHSDSISYECLDILLHSAPIVGHNIKFDLQVLLNLGYISDIEEVKIHDTKILSFLDDENRSNHLKDLVIEVLEKDSVVKLTDVGPRPELENDLLGEKEKIIKDWEEKLGSYCIDDCVNTFELYEYFEKRFNETCPKFLALHDRLEMPFLKVLLNMEKVGVRLDMEYLEELEKRAQMKLSELKTEIWKIAGREFLISSTKQLQEVLLELKINIPENFKTPKGAISTKADSLEYLQKSGVEIAGLLISYREYSKLSSGFIKAIKDKAIEGKIHSQFLQVGTVTGRLSSKSPNLQQIPRREDEFNIRKAFIPRRGYKFVICDISQAELRLLAYFSKDPTLTEAFRNGDDVHQKTADKLGISRFEAKTVNFAVIYGQGSYGLADKLNISKVAAQEIITNYFNEMPYIKSFIQMCYKVVEKHGYITTILGRRRRFPEYKVKSGNKSADFKRDSAIERQIINSRTQGSVGDFVKIAMRDIQKDINELDGNILIQVHDEVIVECPEKHAEKVLEIVKKHMTSAIDIGIPIVADGKICDEWEK